LGVFEDNFLRDIGLIAASFTKFPKTMLPPIRNVTVSVPVPSPSKRWTNSRVSRLRRRGYSEFGGRSTPDSANKYRPRVARVHTRGPTDPCESCPFDAASESKDPGQRWRQGVPQSRRIAFEAGTVALDQDLLLEVIQESKLP